MLEISRRVTPRTCSVLRLHFRSAYHPRDTGDLLTLLKMRFQEPQLLVEGTREGGEQVRRLGIPGFLGGVYGRTCRAGHLGVAVDQGRKVCGDFLHDPCIRVL